MPKIIKPLTVTEIKSAKPEDSPLRDGGGLLLDITPVSKRWRFDYRKPFTKKRTDIGLGYYPFVSLQEARALRDEYKALLAQDIDPKDHIKKRKAQQLGEQLNTFEKVAERWRDSFKAQMVQSETMAEDWRRLEKHIFPHLAEMPVAQINSKLLVEILQPVAIRGHSSVIEKVLRTVVSIMDFAENAGLVEMHNCQKAKKSFHIKAATNNPTILPSELPKFLSDMQSAEIQPKTRLLIFWNLLTAVRPSEAVAVEWSEIDWENQAWHIPAEKMKGRKERKRPHSVPLCKQAMQVLRLMKGFDRGSVFVFASRENRQKPMNSETVNVALKRNGYKDKLTAHGLRSLVRTYLAQQGVETNVAETVLAHDISGKLEKVYNRYDYFEERIAVMTMWGEYVEKCGLKLTPL